MAISGPMSLPDFFFDRVSAEIRQQMDGVLALAEQLARLPLPAEAEGCVAGISDSAAGVRRTLAAAMDLKAAAGESLNLDPAALWLRELTDEVAARWQPRAAAAGVTLLASYDGDPEARVLVDRVRLLQVFDGFVGEAVAGCGRGAVEVSLRALPDPAGVKLEGRVRGGDAWEGHRIEDRVRDVDARLGLEVALGVMLARKLVAGLGGRVGGDGGALFEIVLPAALETPAEPAAPVDPDARAPHVLVVDDNATNRVVAQALCEMLGCTSEAASDGVEAVDAARSGRFDLILMDIRMPRLDGVGATHEIRKLPGKAGAVPILALTANVDPDDATRYVAAGMLCVLEKPMKAEDLRLGLLQALGQTADTAAA